MDKVQQMASFVAVVEAGSFVAAAGARELSKAAVSRHVAELEQRLGIRLLERTTRRQSLTAEGRQFYLRARELLAGIDEAESELGARSGEVRGSLRIHAPSSFGVLHLAPLWGRFAERHPRLRLDITLGDRVVDLVEEGYDLAVRIASLPDSGLASRRLASTRVVLCASPDYLARHGTPRRPAELAAHRTIAYSHWSTRDEWRFDGPEGPESVRIRPVLQANNGDTCRAAALDHQGIILQPDFLVGADLRRGALVELMPAYRSLRIGINVVYPTRRPLPQKVRRLADFLVESFARPSWARG